MKIIHKYLTLGDILAISYSLLFLLSFFFLITKLLSRLILKKSDDCFHAYEY